MIYWIVKWIQNMLKNIKGGVFVIFTIVIACIYIGVTGNYKSLFDALNTVIVFWILLAFISISFYWILEGLIIKTSLSQHNKISFLNAMKLSLIGQFFSSITPFNSGGQPAQVYAMTLLDVKAGIATSALIGKFVVYQIVLICYTGILLVIKYAKFATEVSSLKLILLGFSINTAVIICLMMLSFSKKVKYKFLSVCLTLLYKIKIINSYDDYYEKLNNFIEDFHRNLNILVSNKSILIRLLLLTILQLTCYFIVPCFIYLSFGLRTASLMDLIAATSFVLLITAFVPLPGASGGAEGGFYIIFNLFFITSHLIPALIIWRFLTYYVWLGISGIGMLFIQRDRRSLT